MAGRETRTGGAYLPPFKLAQLVSEAGDREGLPYQRATWDALRKSINGLMPMGLPAPESWMPSHPGGGHPGAFGGGYAADPYAQQHPGYAPPF